MLSTAERLNAPLIRLIIRKAKAAGQIKSKLTGRDQKKLTQEILMDIVKKLAK